MRNNYEPDVLDAEVEWYVCYMKKNGDLHQTLHLDIDHGGVTGWGYIDTDDQAVEATNRAITELYKQLVGMT